METFHLLDLISQALAVQRVLKGRTGIEKLVWLAERGELTRVPTSSPTPRVYSFVSTIGLEAKFFLDGDEFVFLGDHTTFTIKE